MHGPLNVKKKENITIVRNMGSFDIASGTIIFTLETD